MQKETIPHPRAPDQPYTCVLGVHLFQSKIDFHQFFKIDGLSLILIPGAPLAYFSDGGGPKDFFGSDILAKRDFFGSMKDAAIFLGRENNTGIFLGIFFHQLKSTIA